MIGKSFEAIFSWLEKIAPMKRASLPVVVVRPINRGSLYADIGAGLLSAMVMLCYALSYGALIFSGSLDQFLHAGVLVTLVTCVVVTPIIALGSSIRFTIGGPDGNSAAILAVLAAGIAADMAATHAGSGALMVTLLAALALSTVLSGVLLYMLGASHCAALIQFLPFPVIGGYLGGTGYLLLSGAFRVLTGASLHLSTLNALFALPTLSWLPAVVVCATLMLAARTLKSFVLVVPIGIATGLIVFFTGLDLTGMSIAHARDLGLLFQRVPLSELHLPMLLPRDQIHWSVIGAHVPEFLVVAAVSALTILLNATGAGLACQQDPDLDQEMRAAGVANLVAGLFGGIVGYQSLSRTMLNRRAGATGRASGIASALGCLAVVVLCPDLIGWIPKSVLVGLQLYIAVNILNEWLLKSYRKLGRAEYLLIPLIVLVIAVDGVVAGVGLGVIAACVLFVVKYGRISVIRSQFDSRVLHSNVERSIEETCLLREYGGVTIGAALHGFLFFATASSILRHVRERLDTALAPRFVLLDFRHVNGLDASTSLSFLKLRQVCDAAGVTLVLTAMPDGARTLLARAGLFVGGSVIAFNSLDAGLEWVEEQLLATLKPAASAQLSTVPAGLRPHFSDVALARLEAQLEPRELAAGELLFARGDAGDAVYIVERGRVTVSLPLPDGAMLRLRSFGAGTIVGEMALYTRHPRSADVRADVPTLVRRLSLEALDRLEEEDGDAAKQFHRFVVNVLASRLSVSNEAARAAH